MNKAFPKIIVCIFLVFIFVFTSLSVFGKKSDFSISENRALQTMPELSLSDIFDGEFQKLYDSYLSDQFEFRDFWVKAKTGIMRSLGRTDLNGVYFASDGYLIEKYKQSDFDSELVELNIELVSGFLNETSTEWGIPSALALVPSKGSVLTDKMPRGATPFDTSKVYEGFKNSLDKKVALYQLSDSLKEHSDEYIYFKTDHHWTSLGAYYAYSAIMNGLGEKPVPLDSLSVKTVTDDFLGSTFDKVQVETEKDRIDVYTTPLKVSVDYNGDAKNTDTLFVDKKLKEKGKYEYFLGGNFARIDIKTGADNDKTLLLIKDSYANSMLPYLVNNYSRIIMLDLRYFKGDIEAFLDENDDISQILILYNYEKLMTDEHQTLLEGSQETPEDEDDGGEDVSDEELLEEFEEEEDTASDEEETEEDEVSDEELLAEFEDEDE